MSVRPRLAGFLLKYLNIESRSIHSAQWRPTRKIGGSQWSLIVFASIGGDTAWVGYTLDFATHSSFISIHIHCHSCLAKYVKCYDYKPLFMLFLLHINDAGLEERSTSYVRWGRKTCQSNATLVYQRTVISYRLCILHMYNVPKVCTRSFNSYFAYL